MLEFENQIFNQRKQCFWMLIAVFVRHNKPHSFSESPQVTYQWKVVNRVAMIYHAHDLSLGSLRHNQCDHIWRTNGKTKIWRVWWKDWNDIKIPEPFEWLIINFIESCKSHASGLLLLRMSIIFCWKFQSIAKTG